MARQRRLTFQGLNVGPGHYARGDGACIEANNLVVDAPGVIRSRQGFARQSGALGGPVWKVASTKELGSNLLINYGSDTGATALRYGDGSTTPTLITGTVTNDPDARMMVAVARSNHYLTSSEGLRRLESDYTLFGAGMPNGLPLDTTTPTVLVGSPGTLLADGSTVAYRVTWYRADASGLEMQGAPSARTTITNSANFSGYSAGVAKNVTARVLLPYAVNTTGTALTTSYGFRLWRSATVTSGQPPDDMRLVYEAKLSSGDISAGYVDVTDSAPEAFRVLQPPLYTNANDFGEDGVGGPGIQQSNNQPPHMYDVTLWANCLWGCDLTYPHRLAITLLSTVASTGLTAGDMLTIAGRTYTAIAPGTPSAGQFVVVTGTSPQVDCLLTVQNLATAINKDSGNTQVYAYATTGPLEQAQLVLEGRGLATGSFSAVASAHGSAYRPQLGSAVTSTSTIIRNALAFSKGDQPDAWPTVNVLTVGQRSTLALRLVPLSNCMLVFCDVGIYRVTGSNFSNFALDLLDPSFRLAARESVAVCDGAAYAMGTSGFARITENGVDYSMSLPVDPLLWQATLSAGVDWVFSRSWACAYKSRHKVVFAIADDNTISNANLFLVYDVRMNAWTQWSFTRDANTIAGRSTGVARFSDDVLFLGNWNSTNVDAYLFKERRDYATTDYQDTDTAGTTGAITRTITWNVETDGPEEYQEFDEVHALWEVSDTFSALTAPSSVTATFTSDYGAAQSVTIAPQSGKPSSRIIIPQSNKRSSRLKVHLRNAVQSEAFGLEGQVMLIEVDSSTRTTRK